MKISVLTVSFNAAATVQHTVESFLEQDYPDKELLLIDGASTDRTVEIVKSYGSPLIRIFSERDRGMYDALNKGLKLYSGDCFGVLNADDRFYAPHVLSHIVEALNEYDMVHGSLDFVREHGSGQAVRRWSATPRPLSGFRSGWMPAHPTFYVRRQVAERVGLFDLSYQTASDYDWMLRAIECHSFTLGLLPETMIAMKTGGRSTSGVSSSIHHNLEALRSRRKWLRSGLMDVALFAKPARKLGQLLAAGKQKDPSSYDN